MAIPGSKREQKQRGQQKKTRKSLAIGRVLIVCEGEKTEPYYFEWWKKQLEEIRKVSSKSRILEQIKIEVKGEGKVAESLVQRAMDLKNQATIDYTEVWCVFDRDSNKPEQYNTAIEKARSQGIKVAYSNEAFELWYWLHFDYVNSGVSRKQYQQKLTQRMGVKYDKVAPQMYERLLNHPDADQQQAIQRAQNLLKYYEEREDYANHNPSTTVHELVESLNELVWQFRCQVAPAYHLPYPHNCKKCRKSTTPPPPYSCLAQ